jgi:hypothetical protein
MKFVKQHLINPFLGRAQKGIQKLFCSCRDGLAGHKSSTSKLVFFLLMAILVLMNGYFWTRAIQILMTNLSYGESAPARIGRWDVEESGSDEYRLVAHYTFEADDKIFLGSARLESVYLNLDSAISAIKEDSKQKKEWRAWFNRDNPKISALEKSSPNNSLFRASLSLALLLYFLLLRKKIVQRFQRV